MPNWASILKAVKTGATAAKGWGAKGAELGATGLKAARARGLPSAGGILEGITGIGSGLGNDLAHGPPLMKAAALGMGALGIEQLYDMTAPLAKATREQVGGRRTEAAIEEEFLGRAHLDALRMGAERRARDIQVNSMMLAQSNPRLFAQIMAGRKLPRRAIVIGGQPRTDMLSDFVGRVVDDARANEPQTGEEAWMQRLGA